MCTFVLRCVCVRFIRAVCAIGYHRSVVFSGRSVCDGMEDKIITLLIYVYLLILLQVLIRANVFFAICGKCLLKTKLIMAVLSCLLSRVRVVHG